MEITWKGGGPLMTAGGLIGGSEKCCCENPPPPQCWCSEMCSFEIDVTAPSRLRASLSRPYCFPPSGLRSGYAEVVERVFSGLSAPYGFTPVDLDTGPAYTNFSSAGVQQGPYMAATILFRQWYYSSTYSIGSTTGNTRPYMSATVRAVAGFIGCNNVPDDGKIVPKWSLWVQFYTEIAVYNRVGGEYGPQSNFLAIWKRVDADLESFCAKDNKRTCIPSNDPLASSNSFLVTPLTFTLSGDSISIPHTSQPDTVFSSFSLSAEDEAWTQFAEDIRDAAESVTLRITSRPNCLPVVECDCESITNGLTISIYKAPFAPQTFVWNEEEQFASYTDLSSFYSISYGPSGSGNGAVIVMQQWNLSVTELQFEWTVRIFCEAVPSGIPSPYRWYVSTAVECFEWDGGTVTKRTKKTYMGWFGCEADPCGTNGREKGDLYPSGGVNNLELVSTVTPDGYEPCALPTPIYTIFVNNYAECPE